MKLKILFIINPISGVGRSKKVERDVETLLDTEVYEHKFVYTKYKGHAAEISKEIADRFDVVVAVGGDGSVNEVAQGIVDSRTAMAIIPSGSGNGFARYLNIPRDIPDAIKVINEANIKSVDAIRINDNFFVNIAGVGFDARIAHQFANSKRRGFLPYLKLILNDVASFSSEKFTFIIDGKRIEREIFITVFANSSQWGYGAEISPDSKIDDGLLNVCIFNKFPIIEVPILTGKLFDKTILNSKYCESYTAKEIIIISEKEEISAHIDGEPIIFPNNVNIKILPLSLKVIVPTKKRRFIL